MVGVSFMMYVINHINVAGLTQSTLWNSLLELALLARVSLLNVGGNYGTEFIGRIIGKEQN